VPLTPLATIALAVAATAVATAYLRERQGRILGRTLAAALLWAGTCLPLDWVVLMLTPIRCSWTPPN